MAIAACRRDCGACRTIEVPARPSPWPLPALGDGADGHWSRSSRSRRGRAPWPLPPLETVRDDIGRVVTVPARPIAWPLPALGDGADDIGRVRHGPGEADRVAVAALGDVAGDIGRVRHGPSEADIVAVAIAVSVSVADADDTIHQRCRIAEVRRARPLPWPGVRVTVPSGDCRSIARQSMRRCRREAGSVEPVTRRESAAEEAVGRRRGRR